MTSVSKFRTIDNLGIGPSNDYAKNHPNELEVRKQTEDSRIVGGVAEVNVTSPYYGSSDQEQRFSIGSVTIWALFTPPPLYAARLSNLFSYQLIPSLGSPEKLQDTIDRVAALEESLSGDPVQADEYKKVSSLLTLVSNISRTLDLINSRRSQYQKG